MFHGQLPILSDKDNHNDYVNHDDHDNMDDHHSLHLCYEPGDKYGVHLHHSLHSWYGPGEDHDNLVQDHNQDEDYDYYGHH